MTTRLAVLKRLKLRNTLPIKGCAEIARKNFNAALKVQSINKFFVSQQGMVKRTDTLHVTAPPWPMWYLLTILWWHKQKTFENIKPYQKLAYLFLFKPVKNEMLVIPDSLLFQSFFRPSNVWSILLFIYLFFILIR